MPGAIQETSTNPAIKLSASKLRAEVRVSTAFSTLLDEEINECQRANGNALANQSVKKINKTNSQNKISEIKNEITDKTIHLTVELPIKKGRSIENPTINSDTVASDVKNKPSIALLDNSLSSIELVPVAQKKIIDKYNIFDNNLPNHYLLSNSNFAIDQDKFQTAAESPEKVNNCGKNDTDIAAVSTKKNSLKTGTIEKQERANFHQEGFIINVYGNANAFNSLVKTSDDSIEFPFVKSSMSKSKSAVIVGSLPFISAQKNFYITNKNSEVVCSSESKTMATAAKNELELQHEEKEKKQPSINSENSNLNNQIDCGIKYSTDEEPLYSAGFLFALPQSAIRPTTTTALSKNLMVKKRDVAIHGFDSTRDLQSENYSNMPDHADNNAISGIAIAAEKSTSSALASLIVTDIPAMSTGPFTNYQTSPNSSIASRTYVHATIDSVIEDTSLSIHETKYMASDDMGIGLDIQNLRNGSIPVLEARLNNGSQGWVKVRAEMEGDVVHASLSSASKTIDTTLKQQIGAIDTYLQSHHLAVSLSMSNTSKAEKDLDHSQTTADLADTMPKQNSNSEKSNSDAGRSCNQSTQREFTNKSIVHVDAKVQLQESIIASGHRLSVLV